MENLQVIGYEKMQYPLLPRSLQSSTQLRTLILHQCLLMFDLSAIGELRNLEVLSLAHCGIRKLPSSIGKLKELKLLDLTGCVDLRIDDGVLRNLVKLEELYMRVDNNKAIRFTDGNRNELAECSKHLSALEVEFFKDNGIPENMSFTELERFRISMGRSLEDNAVKNLHSFENTLMLVTNKDELLDSRINELFGKTEVLYLEVDGLNVLEEVLLESFHLPQQSFNNLRVLNVFKCKNLRYLFTFHVAVGLMKLERLTISECPVLEVLVYSENGGDGLITFQGLKFLSLDGLPELISFSNIVNVIELPQLVQLALDDLPNFTSIYPTSVTSSTSSDISAIQPFFNKEVLIPKLEILKIGRMNKLKEIWPCQISSSDEVNARMLRKIEVRECDSIVNLFPRNPMSLLCHLEELDVSKCGSIEVLFNINMSCVGQIEEYSSNLRHIKVSRLGKLRELWRMTGTGSSYDILIRSFQAVEKIDIRYLFSPLMGKLLPNLKEVLIEACDGIEEVVSDRDVDENEEIDTSISTTAHTNTISFPLLDNLFLWNLPSLKSIDGGNARGRSRSSAITTTSIHDHFKVGVASWFLCQYSKKIHISSCHALSRVFPSYTVGRLDKLEELRISECESVVEIFEREEGNSVGVQSSNKVGDGSDDTCTTMTVPRSANMIVHNLPNLTKLEVFNCERLEYIFTSSTLESLKNLKELTVEECKGMQVIVKEDGEHTAEASKTIVFPHLKSLTLAVLPNVKGFFLGTNELEWKVLEKVKIYGCPQMMSFTSGHSVAPKLKYIHTGLGKHRLEECGLNFHSSNPTQETQHPMSSTPEMTKLLQLPWSFSNLVEVHAQDGDKLLDRRVIFPCNELLNLKNLEKLCITYAWESTIEEVFEVVEGTNDGVNIETQSVVVFHKLEEVTLHRPPKLRHMWKSNPQIVLNFPNLTKVSIHRCGLLGHVFTSCMVGSLLQLQELQISYCWYMDVIVKQVPLSEIHNTQMASKSQGILLGEGSFFMAIIRHFGNQRLSKNNCFHPWTINYSEAEVN